MRHLYSAHLSEDAPQNGACCVVVQRDGKTLGHAYVHADTEGNEAHVWPVAERTEQWLDAPLYEALYESLRHDDDPILSVEGILELARMAVEDRLPA